MIRAGWQDAARILCIRLDNLGDVLMTTPAIRALRETSAIGGATTRPRHLTLLASTAGCEVARHIPEVDATLAFDAPWVAAGRDRPLSTEIVARLAAYRFDAAVIFTCYSQSALPAAMLCGQAGIPLRLAHSRENPYALLTDWVRDPEPEEGIRHEVARQLALVAAIGAVTSDERLSVRVVPAAQQRVAALLTARGVSIDRPYVVLHPGATAPSRRWPAERFAEVAHALVRDAGIPVLVTGTASEADLVARVATPPGPTGVGAGWSDASIAPPGVHDLSGALALDELIALVDGARLLVSNNSGPVHIAAARRTPVVDLYALTNPQHTPWMVPSRVLSNPVPCANCRRSICPELHHACLTGVGASEAIDAALALLAIDEPENMTATNPTATNPIATTADATTATGTSPRDALSQTPVFAPADADGSARLDVTRLEVATRGVPPPHAPTSALAC